MSKTILIFIIIIILIGAGYWIYFSTTEEPIAPPSGEELAVDPLNASYLIEGDEIALVDGAAEKEIVSGAASKIMVNVFDANTKGDINGDGLEDIVVLLTYEAGGSGAFFYVALALKEEQGYQGTNAVLLGDRIAPQTTAIENSHVVVNYADRRKDEPMTADPSVGITRQFAVEGVVLKEVTSEEAQKEQACLISGGSVETSLCCLLAEDFPDTCLIGACGCSPENSYAVKVCNCGSDRCFNGQECLAPQE